MVDEDDFLLLDPDEQAMLLEQMKAQKDIENEKKVLAEKCKGIFEVRVKIVSNDTINTFESKGKPVAHLLTNDYAKSLNPNFLPKQLVLNFYSSTSSDWFYGKQYVSRKIAKVRYWVPKEDSKLEVTKKHFEEDWDNSTPLKEYVERGYVKDRSFNRLGLNDIVLHKLLGLKGGHLNS